MGKYLDLARRAVDTGQTAAIHTENTLRNKRIKRNKPSVPAETGYEINELNEISPPAGREATSSADLLPEDWDAETLRLIEWFKTATPPVERFELCSGVTVFDPARWWRSIAGDIGCGPTGPRALYGAVQGDLKKLHDMICSEG